MKQIFTLFLTTILIAITPIFGHESNLTNRCFQAKFNKEDIYQTWYVKTILINGQPDIENYPVNNDELTFKADFTYTSIDKTFNMTEKGKWKWINSDSYLLVSDSEPVTFKILELSKSKLRIKMVSDEINMEVTLLNVK